MKKLLYALPLMGIVFFASCEKEEMVDDIQNETVEDFSGVSIDEVQEKAFPIQIAPGLYGPTQVAANTATKYTYHATNAQLNSIPKAYRRYRVTLFYISSGLLFEADSLETNSNTVSINFPNPFNPTQYLLRYEVYHIFNSSLHYSKQKTITVY